MNTFKKQNSFFKINRDGQIKQNYIVQDCDFPSLNGPQSKNENDQSQMTDVTNISFAKVASKNKIDDLQKEDNLKPGWISLEMNKITRNIEISLGPKTQEMIENEKKMQKQDLNYDMNCAIYKIEKNRLHFEKTYDELHGEGKYEEVYKYYENSMNISDTDSETNAENYENDYDYDYDYDYTYYVEDI
jgi:hypothetical protein